PAIACVTLFSIVGHWNNFFDGLLLMNSPEKIPLQTYIQTLTNTNINVASSSMTEEEIEALTSLKTFNAAKVVVASIPIIVFYPFMQKFFITGITLGSVKE
ncbi:MAG: carbohydrate ABC transporter permease, partial [Clostridia bacterium]